MNKVETREEMVAILRDIADAVVNFDEERASKLCETALEKGIDAYDAIMGGLAAGMNAVGKLYEREEYFVPELLLCSDALYAGLEILRPHVSKGKREGDKGSIIIGVVEGDIHDIGKNLVKTMFEAAGWSIHDLGKDVKLERFAQVQEEVNADVVALSALMTTSMLAIPKAISMLREKTPGVVIMVGGAPLTHDIAHSYGADGYAGDAVSAVEETERILFETSAR